ncbi:uncharacterized protein LOC143028249 [Oratosquilla oratoria]|uniref:uncharacterized protein LOC143028249 n=1 Tax=Oratosquilla oratoria TaxID=337810 RepID=UPI003F772F8A
MRMTKTTAVSVALVCSLLAAICVQAQVTALSCGGGGFCRRFDIGPAPKCMNSSQCPRTSTCCFYPGKGCVCDSGDRPFNFRRQMERLLRDEKTQGPPQLILQG